MVNVPFFTPLYFGNGSSNFKDELLERIDSYFYLGGKKAEIISFEKGINLIQYTDKKQTLKLTAIKIVSYFTLILPLIALGVKYVLRKDLKFNLHPSFHKRAILTINEEDVSIASLDKKVIGSTSDTAKISMKNGSSLFWKAWRSIGDKFAGYREIAGSRIANVLTQGLVPVAQETSLQGRSGVTYPWVELNVAPFRTDLKVDEKGSIDFSFLNDKQKHQLFIHVLTDRLISNWDTHNQQYAIDDQGNVISFDKEMAFEGVYLRNEEGTRVPERPFKRTKKEPLTRLALDENHWRFTQDEMLKFRQPLRLINSEFIRQIQAGDIEIDFKNPIVADFFKRCENIEKEKVVELSQVFAEKAFGKNAEQFYELIYKRIKACERGCLAFFKEERQPAMPVWDEESIFGSIQSLDRDYNAQYNVYPVTNELGIEEVQSQLQTFERPNKSLHIGFSGYYNFEIAYKRNSDYILCLDISNGTSAFYKATQKVMRVAKDRLDFVDKLVSKMIKKKHKFYPNKAYDHRTVLAEEIKSKFLSSGWLSKDESFEWIRQKYFEKKIAFIRVDMRKSETFEKLEEYIANRFNVDTLYIANIFDWLSWEAQGILDFEGKKNEQNIVSAYQNIRRILSDKTLVIDATNKTGMSAAKQFLTLGKDFDPITHRERDGGVKLPHP